MKNSPQVLAMFIALACYTLWSAGDAFVKLATEEGMTPLDVMFFCGTLNVLFISLKIVATKRLSEFSAKSKKLMFFRTLIGVLVGFCFYTAYSKVPLANAYVIEFTAPLIIAVGGAIFLSERLPQISVAMVVLGFIGVFVATNPQSLSVYKDDAMGYAAAMAGSVLFAASQLLLRKMSQSEKTETIIFWAAGATVVFSVLMTSGDIHVPSFPAALFMFLASTATLGGWFLSMAALRRAPAAIVSYFQYFQLITGTILGYFIWHTIPAWNVFFGGAIIIVASVALAHQTRKQALLKAQGDGRTDG